MFRLLRFSLRSILIGLLACTVSVQAQTKGSGSIAGTVTLGGKPAKGVPVLASPGSNSSVYTPNQKPAFSSSTTDDEGRYLISGLAAGRYLVAPYQPTSVLPERTMFDTGSKTVSLSENESATNIDFTLTSGAVITGRITGSDGRPLIEQRINVESADGKQTFSSFMGGDMYRTDDRGIYRIYGMPAGNYVVSVGEASSPDTITIGLNNKSFIPRTFYAGATARSDAQVIELTDGSVESGVDITVGPPEKTYSISGRMIDQATGKPVANVPAAYGAVRPGTGSMGASVGASGTSSSSDQLGNFKLNALKPGRYAVFAGGFSMGADKWTSDPVVVDITDSNVTDVEIKVRVGASIDGIAVVEGSSDPEVVRKLSAIRVQVFNSGPANSDTIRTPNGRSVQIGPDGRFHVDGLSAGRSSIFISQTGGDQIFSLKTVEQDGNVVSDNVIEIEPGVDHANVRLVLETGSGTIRGQLNLVGGEIPAGWRLSGNVNRTGQSGLNVRSFTIDSRGRFLVEHLAPGEFEVMVIAYPGSPQTTSTRPIPSVRQTVTVPGGTEVNVAMTLDLTPRTGGPPQ